MNSQFSPRAQRSACRPRKGPPPAAAIRARCCSSAAARTSIQPCPQSTQAKPPVRRSQPTKPRQRRMEGTSSAPPARPHAATNRRPTQQFRSWADNPSCCACRWSYGSKASPGQRSTSWSHRTSFRCQSSYLLVRSPGCSLRSKAGSHHVSVRIDRVALESLGPQVAQAQLQGRRLVVGGSSPAAHGSSISNLPHTKCFDASLRV